VFYPTVYLLYAAAVAHWQRDLLFARHLAPSAPYAAHGVRALERWTIPVDGGVVEAWYLSAIDAPGTRHPTVVFAHGNGETSDLWIRPLERLRMAGFNVLIPEYRGYGRSAGLPSEEAIVHDFEQFLTRLRARPEADPAEVIYMGRSLGGGVSCALAALQPPAALVLQSAFQSMAAMAHRRLLPAFLVADPFDNLGAVSGLQVPVYVAHGRTDRLIPFSDGELLAHTARRSELHPMDCGHGDCPPDLDAFLDDVTRFLNGVLTKS
jgi:pimeloyl-ACP methyl ester carboxylesterase